jgi:uncharacterized protein YjbI with pentapeptide repeats
MMDIGSDDQVGAVPWPTCAYRRGETGVACNGRQVDGFEYCLAHLEPEELEQILQRFSPGADLDARGTNITAALLARIVRAVVSENGPPRFGAVNLEQAHFIEDASFADVQFTGDAWFDGAQFSGETVFYRARFSGFAGFRGAQFSEYAGFRGTYFSTDARFDDVQFDGAAGFRGARFGRDAVFLGAQFGGTAGFLGAQFGGAAGFTKARFGKDAVFHRAQFGGAARFDDAQFGRAARFDGALFRGNAVFTSARFEKAISLGPLISENLVLERAVFVRPAVLEAAAGRVTCTDATWEAGVTMRLWYAQVDLERATFTVPSFVTGASQPFEFPDFGRLDLSAVLSSVLGESRAHGPRIPIVLSLRGVDAANLSVTDVDLSQCRFAGAKLLDQLRVEGRCNFDHPPEGLLTGWAWLPMWRWSSRQSLAEERLWRRTTLKHSGWGSKAGKVEVEPERVAGLYRQLRKAQEDIKNEPGAADFYYGEMEMRRHAPTTPAAERVIVWLYWLISGYGLRALRSLAALAILGVIVTTVLTGWGLAATAPSQHMAGTVTITPHKPARINATLRGTTPQIPPPSQRWTRERAQTALQITLESIAFRTTTQPVTSVGTWTTIAVRILGPVLLALALLAVRNRIKR